jgi:hypothetical protein
VQDMRNIFEQYWWQIEIKVAEGAQRQEDEKQLVVEQSDFLEY